MILFKYCSWKDGFTKDNLRLSAVYMASADSFNDPADCLPAYDKNVNLCDAEACFLNQLENSMGFPPEYAKKVAPIMAKFVLDNPEWLDLFEKETKPNWQRLIGVCCFTTNPRHPVMWGNYANKHRGICLCYNLPDNVNVFSLPEGKTCDGPIRAFPMEYSDQRPRPKILFAPGEYHDLVRSLWTKSKEWEYEQEWRVTTVKYVGHAHYSPDALQGIIIGCKMAPEDIEEVKQLINELPSKPTLFQAKLNLEEYKIDINPLESSWEDLLKRTDD